MQKIFKLPPAEAQKIAAGEVVERPASVVKELIENALDAGATSITVYAKNGGKDFLQIIDNGCGMSPCDAHLSIVQHATSKIRSMSDLASLTTFGFRGEALSSIAAVSTLTLVTKEKDAQNGIKLVIQGEQIHEEVVSTNHGTMITVENLYYNVPARKKFLKTRETEWRAIMQLLQALCLAYPHCSFKIFHDDREVLLCPPSPERKNRIAQLFDHQTAQAMLEGTSFDESIKVSLSCAISNVYHSRYDRLQIFVFVNNRWVKNYKLSQAILKGYGNRLPKDRFPSAFIFISIDPAYVDINIHPRKEEVQFVHPGKVHALIEQTIDSLLQSHSEIQFSSAAMPVMKNNIYQVPSFVPETKTIIAHAKTFDMPLTLPTSQEKAQFKTIIEQTFNQSPVVAQQLSTVPEAFTYQLIGQLHATYIMLETEQGLLVIDQHAAHERILYEQFSQRFNESALVKLIFPEMINISAADTKLLHEIDEILREFDVHLEHYSNNQIMIQAVPVYLKDKSMADIIQYVLSFMHEHHHVNTDELKKKLHESLQAQMACKAAVKAGDILSVEKMHEIVRTLETTPRKISCPHGRPTSWFTSFHELEKIFRRKL